MWIICVALLGAPPLFAREVDSFSHRYESIQDSAEILNIEVNQRLDAVLVSTNREYGCSKSELFEELKKRLHRPLMGLIEQWIDEEPSIDKRFSKKSESIYKNFDVEDGFSFSILGDNASLAPVLRVSGVLVGSDKFGHFFDEGFSYYEIYSDQRSIDLALDWGERTENGIYGFKGTGVRSYGDLVANYQGLLFWSSVVDRGPDNTATPYFSCNPETNQWERTRDFDVADYVDSAWDEGINCSEYSSERALNKISMQLRLLSEINGRDVSCPAQADICPLLVSKYGYYSGRLIGPTCRKVVAGGRVELPTYGL